MTICKYTNIVAAFWGMHVSPAKHTDFQESMTTWQTDGTDAGQSDPYVPLCFAGDTKNTFIVTCKLVSSFYGFHWNFNHLNSLIRGIPKAILTDHNFGHICLCSLVCQHFGFDILSNHGNSIDESGWLKSWPLTLTCTCINYVNGKKYHKFS